MALKTLVWGAPGALVDPPIITLAEVEQDCKILMELFNKYGLLDSVDLKDMKAIMGKRIGYDDKVVTAVTNGLTRSPQVNPGSISPASMTQQKEAIQALGMLGNTAGMLVRGCTYSRNLRQVHLWEQTTSGADAINASAAQQKNQTDRDPGVMESAQQVQDAVAVGLARKKDTADGKDAAVAAAEQTAQKQLAALQIQYQQMMTQLAATQAALATATGQNPPAVAATPAQAHHKKVTAPAPGAPSIPSLGTPAEAQRKNPR